MATLEPGAVAPAFELMDQRSNPMTNADLAGERALIYFYPRANTPGCTTQSCELRDIAGRIGSTRIVGVSPDTPAKQLGFDEKHGLGFPLLSDTDHAMAEAFGVRVEKKARGKVSMGILRSAFLLDADGVIGRAWYKISPRDTAPALLDALGLTDATDGGAS